MLFDGIDQGFTVICEEEFVEIRVHQRKVAKASRRGFVSGVLFAVLVPMILSSAWGFFAH